MAHGNVSRSGSDGGYGVVRNNTYLQIMENRYAALLPFALVGQLTLAQTPFEYADQQTQQVFYAAAAAGASGTFAVGTAGEETGVNTYGFVTKFSPDGAVLWSSGVNTDEYGFIPTAAMAQEDGGVIVSGRVNGCDVGPWYYSSLMKYGADGTQQWAHVYTFGGENACVRASVGSVAIWNDDSVLVATVDGDSLTAWPAGSESILSTDRQNDSALVIASPYLLERRDLFGTLLSSYPTTDTLACAAALAEHVLALQVSGDLLVFDQSLSPTGAIPLDSTFASGQLVHDDGILWVIGTDMAIAIDAFLNVIDTIALDPFNEFAPFHPTRCAAGDGRLSICWNEHFQNRNTGLLRAIGGDGSVAAHPLNIAISIAGIDSTWYSWYNGTPYGPRANISVLVTNLGSEPMNSVALNVWYTPWICSAAGDTRFYGTPDLQPGASTTLLFDDVYLNGPPLSSDTVDFPICIAALSPNHAWDRDMSDNLACGSAQIVLGLDDHAVATNDLIIANPFSGALDLVFITPSQEPVRATLFDAIGRPLATTNIATGSTHFHWDLPGLSDGVHILRLEDRSTTTIRKLIHEQP